MDSLLVTMPRAASLRQRGPGLLDQPRWVGASELDLIAFTVASEDSLLLVALLLVTLGDSEEERRTPSPPPLARNALACGKRVDTAPPAPTPLLYSRLCSRGAPAFRP